MSNIPFDPLQEFYKKYSRKPSLKEELALLQLNTPFQQARRAFEAEGKWFGPPAPLDPIADVIEPLSLSESDTSGKNPRLLRAAEKIKEHILKPSITPATAYAQLASDSANTAAKGSDESERETPKDRKLSATEKRERRDEEFFRNVDLSKLDAAAVRLLKECARLTRQEDDGVRGLRERGGDILFKNGQYYHDNIVTGTKNKVTIGVNSKYGAAWAHTHPPAGGGGDSDWDEKLSNDRKKRGDVQQLRSVRRQLGRSLYAYLGTPSGAVRRFGPNHYRGAGIEIRKPGTLRFQKRDVKK